MSIFIGHIYQIYKSFLKIYFNVFLKKIVYIFFSNIVNEYIHYWDFPSGPVVKTLPSNAGGMGLIPDRGAKIPHAVGRGQRLK